MGRKMTSLSAGYAICGHLQTAMGNKINGVFPIYCKDSDIKYPFITYRRGESEREPTKSPYNADADSCSITVRVFDDDYERGLELIEEARSALEGHTITYFDDDGNTLKVFCAKVTSSDEDISNEGAYAQEIIITCKIK